jgi:hypothetical protein
MRTQNRADKGAETGPNELRSPTVGAELGGGGAGGHDRHRAAGEPDESPDPGGSRSIIGTASGQPVGAPPIVSRRKRHASPWTRLRPHESAE